MRPPVAENAGADGSGHPADRYYYHDVPRSRRRGAAAVLLQPGAFCFLRGAVSAALHTDAGPRLSRGEMGHAAGPLRPDVWRRHAEIFLAGGHVPLGSVLDRIDAHVDSPQAARRAVAQTAVPLISALKNPAARTFRVRRPLPPPSSNPPKRCSIQREARSRIVLRTASSS